MKVLHVKIEESTHRKIKAAAAKQGVTLAAIVEQLAKRIK